MELIELLLIIFILLFLLALVSSMIFAFSMLVHCLIMEKNPIKKVFWSIVIIIFSGAGAALYVLIRIPVQKKERNDPIYHPGFEDRILGFFSRRKIPGPKTLKRLRLKRGTAFSLLYVFLVIYIFLTFLIIYCFIRIPTDANLSHILPVFFLSLTSLVIIYVSLMHLDPRRGWNIFLIIEGDPEKIKKVVKRLGYEEENGGFYYPMDKYKGIFVRTFYESHYIKEELKALKLSEVGVEPLILFTSWGYRSIREPLRVLEKRHIAYKDFNKKVYIELMGHLEQLTDGPVFDLTFSKPERVVDDRRIDG